MCFSLELREINLFWCKIFLYSICYQAHSNEMAKMAQSDAAKWELWHRKKKCLLFEPKIQGALRAFSLYQ